MFIHSVSNARSPIYHFPFIHCTNSSYCFGSMLFNKFSCFLLLSGQSANPFSFSPSLTSYILPYDLLPISFTMRVAECPISFLENEQPSLVICLLLRRRLSWTYKRQSKFPLTLMVVHTIEIWALAPWLSANIKDAVAHTMQLLTIS